MTNVTDQQPTGQPTAIVTGAGSGIGEAIARRLAADGYAVGVNDLRAEAADRVCADLTATGATAVPLVFDVTDSGAVDGAVDGFVERHGRLDVMVNNAGAGNSYTPAQIDHAIEVGRRRSAGERPGSLNITVSRTDDEFQRVVDVILFGTFCGTRAALRHMEPARRGAIVNTASTAGLMASPLAPEYGAAKAAVVGFTRSVGQEVAGCGVRVNAVAPGTIDTPLLDRFGALKPSLATRHASGRLGRPEEIAAAVAFLASDEASYCFGEILTVSGGLG